MRCKGLGPVPGQCRHAPEKLLRTGGAGGTEEASWVDSCRMGAGWKLLELGLDHSETQATVWGEGPVLSCPGTVTGSGLGQ